MKKLNYFLLGLAGLTLASCSQDDILDTQKGDGNCHLIVSLPNNVATRAYGDAMTANNLYVAVYDQDNNLAQDPFTVSFNNNPELTTTVDLNLPTGQTYNIALFAAAEQAYGYVYTFDWENAIFNVNYDKMGFDGTNADFYDCFYKLQPITVGTTQITETVLLTRPIAKINWGTSEFAAGNKSVQTAFGTTGQYIRTNFKAEDVYYQFDLLNSDVVEGKVMNVEFEGWAAPSGWTFPNVSETTTYTYVAQQFLLAPDNSTTYDLQMTINNDGNENVTNFENDLVVASAPVEANYQTNIYGALLTDNVNFEVKKDANWSNPDYSVVIGAEKPAQDPEGNYLITNQAELTWVAQQVNGNSTSTRASDDPRTASYKLSNDIYMVGNWTPIGIDFAHRFGGSFDGQNYTIYNLNVNSNNMTGLFGFMNGTVENLNLDNAKIVSNHWAAVIAGFSDNETGSTYIKNCKVTNSSVTLSPEQIDGKWDNGDKGGLIIGYMASKDQVTGCTVENCTLQGYRDLGGIIGYANGSVITNNTVNGLTITVNKAQNYEGYTQDSQYDANNVIGQFVKGTYGEDSGNTSSDVSVEYGVYANATSQAELQAAVGTPNAIITLQPGSYSLPNNVAKGVTFIGSSAVVIDIYTANALPKGGYNDVTFKGITFTGGNGHSYFGIQGTNVAYENCTFNGLLWNYSDGLTFTKCTFNQNTDEYCAWLYTANNVEFDGCQFNCYNKGLLLYNEGGISSEIVEVKNCTFKASNPEEGKAAIMVNESPCSFNLTISNCTEENFGLNTLSSSRLWGLKGNPKATITLNGTQVYNVN